MNADVPGGGISLYRGISFDDKIVAVWSTRAAGDQNPMFFQQTYDLRENSGYIPNDVAFGYQTFEVLSSRLQPGCAESAIVTGLLDLMGDSNQK